ncbi:MAG TPA: tetratricopeptide repeat protein, partial [Thermomicrobiales bacterium]|nr:tetratricopeptide repeat protein [Thermomicrobiales bacterium]
PGAPFVVELLGRCPRLKILATSRSRLRLRGEREFVVPPLALPPAQDDARSETPVERLAEVAAVRLFVARAADVRPGFALTEANAADVVAICRRLDGLPLALELAAAWAKALPPALLRQRLRERLLALTGGARDLPPRQQTLRATIAWSYDLLRSDEQRLVRRLAVFAGGWSLEAAEAIVESADDPEFDVVDGLTALVDHSLVRHEEPLGAAPRFGMFEMIREYAIEQLRAAGEEAAVRARHTRYFLALAERGEAALTGPDQAEWFAWLAREYGNLRAALTSAVERDDAATALRFGSALWSYWARQGQLSEGRAWLERALALDGDATSPSRIRARQRLANLAVDLADYARAETLYATNLAACQARNDEDGIALAKSGLGLVAGYRGNYDNARALYQAALARWRETGDRRSEAIELHNLGDAANAVGAFDEARARHQAAMTIQEAIGDVNGTAYSILSLAEATSEGEGPAAAGPLFERSLAMFVDVGDQLGLAYARFGLGRVALDAGDTARANAEFAASLASRREFGDRRGIIECVEGVAEVATATGQAAWATGLVGAATAARVALSCPLPPIVRRRHEQMIGALRTALGEAGFAAAYAAGQSLTLEQAADAVSDWASEPSSPDRYANA